jgi:hypothetical protein
LRDLGAMEVCSSIDLDAPGASHLGTGDHGPKTDRSRPRSVPVNAPGCRNTIGEQDALPRDGKTYRPVMDASGYLRTWQAPKEIEHRNFGVSSTIVLLTHEYH